VVTLYLPGDGPLHRMPAGAKLVLLVAAVLGVSLLPTAPWSAAAAGGACVAGYLVAGFHGAHGLRELGRQSWTLRWVIVLVFGGLLIFLGPMPAALNTARVVAAVLLAMLLALTTRMTALLDALERGLLPLAVLRVDPARVALLLTIAISTVPVMIRIAHDVREAQLARGISRDIRAFAVPYLVMALKHADELGDALAARGVR